MARKKLGFMQLAILFGFSLFYCCYLLVFFGIFLMFPQSATFVEQHVGQAAFFFGSIVGTVLLVWRFRRADNVRVGHARSFRVVSFATGVLLPACVVADALGAEAPIEAVVAVALLTGTGFAGGFMLWEDISIRGYLKESKFAHGVSFGAGGILFVLCMLVLSELAIGIACMLLMCASAALLSFIDGRCEPALEHTVKPAIAHFKTTWHLDIITMVINVAFGFAFMLLYQMGQTTLLLAMGVAIVVDFAVVIFFGRTRRMPFVGAVRVICAIVACALILYACPGDLAKTASMCTVVVLWFVYRTTNGGALVEMAVHNDYSILYSTSRGKISTNIGFFIGLVVGIAAIGAGGSQDVFAYIALALVAAFVVSALFFLPFENEVETPGYKTLAVIREETPDGEAAVETERDRNERFARHFKLSPREQEVFAYVVKGRNAKHVAGKLYISESTAKTHIANIYRKADVHSQQELLDLLEEF